MFFSAEATAISRTISRCSGVRLGSASTFALTLLVNSWFDMLLIMLLSFRIVIFLWCRHGSVCDLYRSKIVSRRFRILWWEFLICSSNDDSFIRSRICLTVTKGCFNDATRERTSAPINSSRPRWSGVGRVSHNGNVNQVCEVPDGADNGARCTFHMARIPSSSLSISSSLYSHIRESSTMKAKETIEVTGLHGLVGVASRLGVRQIAFKFESATVLA